MFSYFRKSKETKIAGFLFGLQLLAQVLLPAGMAHAQAVFPGTPLAASQVNNTCFSANQSFLGASSPYCYATMAACTAAYATVPFTQRITTCHDNALNTTAVGRVMANIRQLPADAGNMVLDLANAAIGKAVAFIAEMAQEGASKFLLAMAFLLDESISRTVDSATYRDLAVVSIGWTAVRDFSNMFFIFVLLYISILTVLGMAGSNAKSWVAHLIIAALLINFSLFFTQVVIDSGNILAVGFWDNIRSRQGSETVSSASAKFMEGFRIQTVYSVADDVPSTPTQPRLDPYHRAMINFGGALLMLIAGYLFLAGAIMMIIRTVTLLILLIVSPFAFLGFALPRGGGFATKWLDKLIGATFVAPVFIFMLYLNSVIISSADVSRLTGMTTEINGGTALGGAPNNFVFFYNYFLMAILLLSSLTVAKSVSSGVGDSAGGWAKKAIGGGAAAGFIGAAAVGRQAGGRIGKATAESTALQNMAKSNNRFARMVGNAGLKTGTAMKSSTFDIRNAPMGGLGVTAALGAAGIKVGAGSKKTYDKDGGGLGFMGGYRGTAGEAEIDKIAKERFPNNPVAQQKYREDMLGKQYKKPEGEYAVDRHKDVRTELERKVQTQAEKAKLTEHTKAMESKSEADREIYLNTVLAGTTKSVREVIGESLGKLNAKETSELSEKILGDKEVQKHLNNAQLAAISTKAAEYKDQNLIPNMTRTVLDGGSESGKRYMRAQVSSGTSNFRYDYEKELKTQQAKYDAAVIVGDAAQQAASENEIKNVMSRVDAKDIAGLEEDLLTHKAMASNYKNAHIDAIQKKGGHDDAFVESFHNAVNTYTTDAKAKGVLDKALRNNQSNLFNAAVAQKRYDAISDPVTGKLAAASAAASAATTPADIAMRQAEVTKLKQEQSALQKALA